MQNSDFAQWIENVARGSKVTAEAALRRMGRVCILLNTSPGEIARMPRKEAGELLVTVVSRLEKEGNRGSSIAGYVKSLKSWWLFNDVEVTKPVRLSRDEGLYDNERVPSSAELQLILDHADLQKRAACAIMAFAGVRPQVLGNRDADDGLRVSDLPEMTIKDGDEVEFPKVPTLVVVRKTLSKTRHQYLTFLPEQGCNHVRQYLRWRMRAMKEKLSPSSPIITANPTNRPYLGRFIRTTNISDEVRTAIRKAGFKWRPYVLRRYFDTRMMGAEQDGVIIRDCRAFWMGHSGDVEHTYTLNKGQLPQDLMEGMREAFARASEKYLVTSRRETISQETVLATINHKFLELAGYTDEEISNMQDLSKLSVDEMKQLLRAKDRDRLGLNGNKQKVVPMSEVKRMVEDGWEFVSGLPGEECVVRLPS
jgi:integrase